MMNTLRVIEKNDPFYSTGLRFLHLIYFRHREDNGGDDVVCLTLPIPEAQDSFGDAMEDARRMRARLAIVCDTLDQARDAAAQAGFALPEHERISIERADAGIWGRVH